IASLRVVDIPTVIQKNLECLSETGFKKQSLSYGSFGSSRSRRFDGRWGGAIAAGTASGEEKEDKDPRCLFGEMMTRAVRTLHRIHGGTSNTSNVNQNSFSSRH